MLTKYLPEDVAQACVEHAIDVWEVLDNIKLLPDITADVLREVWAWHWTWHMVAVVGVLSGCACACRVCECM